MDKRDLYSSPVWFAVAGFAFYSSLNLGIGGFHNPGPGFLLFWASLFLAFFTVIMLVMNFFSKKQPPKLSDQWQGLNWGKVAVVVMTVILYVFLMPKLGFLLATFALMIVLFGIGKLKPWIVLVMALFSVIVSYYLFYTLLKVPLPRGILFF